MNLRSDYFSVQPKVICSYIRDGESLLRGPLECWNSQICTGISLVMRLGTLLVGCHVYYVQQTMNIQIRFALRPQES